VVLRLERGMLVCHHRPRGEKKGRTPSRRIRIVQERKDAYLCHLEEKETTQYKQKPGLGKGFAWSSATCETRGKKGKKRLALASWKEKKGPRSGPEDAKGGRGKEEGEICAPFFTGRQLTEKKSLPPFLSSRREKDHLQSLTKGIKIGNHHWGAFSVRDGEEKNSSCTTSLG